MFQVHITGALLKRYFRLLFSFSGSYQAVNVKLSLDALLQMPGSQVKETMRRLGFSSEDCTRLCAALNCLKSASESGECSFPEILPILSSELTVTL